MLTTCPALRPSFSRVCFARLGLTFDSAAMTATLSQLLKLLTSYPQSEEQLCSILLQQKLSSIVKAFECCGTANMAESWFMNNPAPEQKLKFKQTCPTHTPTFTCNYTVFYCLTKYSSLQWRMARLL